MIRNISIFLILMLCCKVSYSQDTLEVIEYWESGKIRVEGFLVNGERHGLWKEYTSDGQLEMEGNYIHGKNDGKWFYYCPHGIREKIVWWEEGICKHIQYHFLDEDPFVDIKFKDGIGAKEYLDFHNNHKIARRTQLDLFNKSMSIDGRNIHYLSSKRFVYLWFTPSLLVNGRYHLLPDGLLYSMYRIDSLLMKNLKELSLNFDQEVSFNVYTYDVLPRENIYRSKDGRVFHDSIVYFEISPYGRFEEWNFVDNKLVQKIEYHPAVEWYHTCSRYYENGQLESRGDYEKGLRKGKWRYYTNYGDHYKTVKYKKDKATKEQTFDLNKEEINEY